ncbi:MAG: hypothetical protein KDE27_29970, partial [Planctomycetes bacterium]|nr:hypothetical protein [Planctomycetota bacterium]
MNPTNTLAFALITTLTGSIGAQDPIPLARPDRIPIHELQIDRQPAQIWGAGRDYKVSFHDGMNFVPYLGHDYPVNQPFGWTTTSVRIGEVELLTGSPPRLTTSDFRAELDLGVVVEAYDLLPQGLEQTFVLPRRPLAAGPLVVTGALATRLTPRVSEPGHGALTFVDGHDRAILTYGAATAVDADGRRFAMTTRCVAGTIELALDAVAVANARFPLTVDPLLGPATTYTANMNYWSVDCENATAEGTPSHRVLHAFSFESSATDADIVCYTYSSSYFGSAPVFSDLSLESTPRVACGYVAATNRWVIVYEALTQSIRRLRAHVRTVDDMSVGTIVNSLSTPAGLHDWRPDVGGTMFNGNTKALVVFQRESLAGSFADTTTSSVMGVMLETGSAFGTWNTPFQISAAGNYDSERPSVAQQAEGSSNGFWMCAYQEFNNTLAGDDFDVVARRVGAGGTVQPGQWRSDFDNLNPAWHQLSPIVAGYEGRYAVLFTVVPVATQPHPTFDFGSELRLECFDWYEGQPLPNPTYDHPPIQLQATAQLELIPTGLSFDTQSRSHWAATWLRNAPTGPQALAARCAHNGTVLEGPLTAFAATAGESVTAASVTFDR